MVTTTMAQKHPENTPFQKEWRQIDSLTGKGLPQSAAKIARQVLVAAKEKKDNASAIKAQIFLMGVDESIQENADIRNLLFVDSLITESQGSEKALWQSINAEQYWQYFQQNRWRIYNRTPIQGEAPTDIATWDAPAFINKASTLYLASIAEREQLKAIPVKRYMPILAEGKNTRHLRPTLYDFLVFRAIEFFQDDEKDVISPAYRFQVDGALWFEPAQRFSEVRVKPADPDALHFKALSLYQEIISFHLNDKEPDALIDADLHRLQFVHTHSVNPHKDSLYLDALFRLEKQYRKHPASAEVSFRIVQQQYGNGVSPTDGPIPMRSGTQQSGKRDVPALRAKLEQIIAQHPDTEGAAHATELLNQIQMKEIALKVEEVNIPKQNIRALITYRNVDKIHLSLYKIPIGFEFRRGNDQEREATRQALQALAPVKAWEQSLPGTADMETHHTEIKVDALPAGSYALVATVSPNSGDLPNLDLGEDNSLIHLIDFQVSRLSLISNTGGKQDWLYVLDRQTGKPVAHAKAQYWEQRWDAEKQINVYSKLAENTTDKEGKSTIPNGDRQYTRINRITLIAETDTLRADVHLYRYRDNADEPKAHSSTFLFTDRAIYRPGQTIYFKGIMVERINEGKKNRVLPNRKTEVTLYDANGQVVSTTNAKSNEFGSFEGSFIAPETGLTGEMRIQEEHGSVAFSVEEYKRPKFFVEFDTLKGNYALNEQLTVKAHAKAYAGNNIDGAEVKYRVVRQTRFPYFWAYYRWGQPQSQEMEIANGTAITKADGTFEVTFETIPDRSINPETLPTFTYQIHADVTDISGETRSGSQQLHVGYRSLQIIAAVDETIESKELTLTAYTQNMNGVFTPAQLHLNVAPLRFPEKIFRKRLWEKPDQFVLSEQEYRNAFPDDEYQEESNYLNWEKGETAYETSFTTTADGQVTIPQSAWGEEGWYVLELKGKDKQGNEITERKYTYLVDPSGKSLPQRTLLVHTNQKRYEPGDQLELSVKAGHEGAYLLESRTQSANTLPYPIGDRQHIEQPITENDRGGIAYQWIYVYNNRVYTAQHQVQVPWSNRDLQLEWATHRDKLLPGEQEEWTLTVKGDKKDNVAAELLTGMYDASLDAFKPHQWRWDRFSPDNLLGNYWNTQYGFGSKDGIEWKDGLNWSRSGTSYTKIYDRLYDFGRHLRQLSGTGMMIRGMATPTEQRMALPAGAAKEEAAMSEAVIMGYGKDQSDGSTPPPPTENEENIEADPLTSTQVRTNLQETAFFLPQLRTDSAGSVTFKFTIPEALTEWKMMAFAHTQDWKTGYLEGRVKTQKDLMVMPNLPRFLRQGDDIHISAKISNLGEQVIQGTARLEILDATTLEPITTSFIDDTAEKNFSARQSQSTAVSWALQIPNGHFEPVVVRITAKAGNFTDGEENTLPVITNRMLVTETLPLPVRGNESKSFTLPKLLNPESNTLSHHALTVEFTGNPAWYAVQALPYLMEYPYECAEQVFNRFYANALAAHIVAQSPKVSAIFDQWRESDTTALLSNLEKNQELKSALLEETPWVMEAKNESEQKRRIALLFDSHKLAQGLQQNLTKLAEMQLPEGSFPWFRGMQSNRYITQYIITGIARLKHLGVEAANTTVAKGIIDKALPYLDQQIKVDYDQLVERKAKLDDQQIGYSHVQYLYMRSFFASTPLPEASRKAFGYYQAQAKTYWAQFNPYLKGQIALALHRSNNEDSTPADIMASLRETSIQHEEMGMYWKSMPRGYWWHEAPIEAQALLVEAFAEIGKNTQAVDDLKVWLLKQKQTQHWNTTKATADAIYALLLQGSDWLANEPIVNITLGQEHISSTEVKAEAGTGYFKKRFEGDAVKQDMGNITVKVDKVVNEGVAWGAVYWQYFENLDKITSAETPLSLRKQLYIERNTDSGPVLTEITEGNALKVGDKVKIRIELRVDRDMEYVHLKDMRAACFEPINVLSGYRYQGGLGYYESTKDVSTNFFFDYLRKGTYVFEYPVFVSQAGDFSNGISTIQCMYAPEFSSHSAGIRVSVE